MKLIFLKPFRCKDCSYRFFRWEIRARLEKVVPEPLAAVKLQ
jgi:hypothetical protein